MDLKPSRNAFTEPPKTKRPAKREPQRPHTEVASASQGPPTYDHPSRPTRACCFEKLAKSSTKSSSFSPDADPGYWPFPTSCPRFPEGTDRSNQTPTAQNRATWTTSSHSHSTPNPRYGVLLGVGPGLIDGSGTGRTLCCCMPVPITPCRARNVRFHERGGGGRRKAELVRAKEVRLHAYFEVSILLERSLGCGAWRRSPSAPQPMFG